MHTENSIRINAPRERIFEVAANLELWPKILPHYRWIRFLERSGNRNIVQMAARRTWIPIRWTSIQEIDREKMEIRFHHLKGFTKGMNVVWTFTPIEGCVEVRIRHDLRSRFPILGNLITKRIIGDFFIGHVANRTLFHMKKYMEASDET